MNYRFSSVLGVLFLALPSLADDLHGEGFQFTAPSVFGSANVSNPAVGDIIYDRTAAGFFGYNQSGSWVSLGPDISNGTLAVLSNWTGVAVHGTNTNDNAAAGYIGEYITANPAANVTPAASRSFVNVASITLSAGDWDVEGVVNMVTDVTWAGTQWGVQISTSSNASDSAANGGINWNTGNIAAGGTFYIPTGVRRLSLIGANTPIYLTAQLTYSALGSTVFGTNSFIRARRVR